MSFTPFQGMQTRIARESDYGTLPGSPAWKTLQGFGVVLSRNPTKTPVDVPGFFIPTGYMLDDDFSDGDVNGSLDFNALWAIFSGVFGLPTTTNLGGSPTAYRHAWSWNGKTPNRPASYALDYGVSATGERAAGWLFNGLNIDGDRAKGFKVKGKGFGKASATQTPLGGVTLERQTVTITGTPTGGSFQATWNGETTSTVLFSATAATFQTALEGLTQINPGDVTVGGGPGPGTPYTVDFGGAYAGLNVSLMTFTHTFTGGASPNISATETTPGADGSTIVPIFTAGAVDGNVYIDPTWAGLGSTQQGYMAGVGLDFPDRMRRVRPVNKSKATDGIIDNDKLKFMVNLRFFRNSTEATELANLIANTPRFTRLEWLSTTNISGANPYRLRIDASLIYSDIGKTADQEGAAMREYKGAVVPDGTTGNAIAVELQNAVLNI